jgi:hypothetical protein
MVFGVKFFYHRVDIGYMKKLALIMMLSTTSVVLSAEEYTIQTISAQKEASITPAFEKKVHKSALASSNIKEGSCNIVTVGKYPTAKAAKADIRKAKKISKDVFVRTLHRETPKVCGGSSLVADHGINPVHTGQALVGNSNEAKSSKKETVAVNHDSEKNVVVHEEAKPITQTNVATPSVSSFETVGETKTGPCKTQPCTKISNNLYIYDRSLARKSDVSDAIEYYKTSPYYSFRPVSLQK